MRIAYCGHSHHQVTRSHAFLLDALRERAAVDEYWDDGWRTGAEFDATPVLDGKYDAVIVWQMERLAQALARTRLPNLTFFPMYDGCHAMPDSFWRELQDVKVVCFSSTLHEKLQRLGVRARFVRYFPAPSRTLVDHSTELSGFFWQRQQDITWRTIRRLLGETRIRLTLHHAMDPSYGELAAPDEADRRRYAIRTTRWFPSPAAAAAELSRHNVYFAPRLREGIGLSFLEAMAMGFLVVAPDRPTMSEYVVSDVNGLLYDPDDPRPLDFARHAAMGERARRSIEAGREVWLRCLPGVLELIATPNARVPVEAPLNALDPRGLPGWPRPRPVPGRSARTPSSAPGSRGRAGTAAGPRVTVAVVTLDAEATLARTLDSILAQDWPDLEVIVRDGASRDGTLAIIRAYQDHLDRWRSEPDGGPYEAMNAAAREATGRYVLFMNAGDHFHSTDAITQAMAGAPADATVVFGHHVYRDVHGIEEIHASASFDETWALLRSGHIGWRWLSRVPGHQATFTATEFLRANPYRSDLRIAADHELLYRAARQGARFHHCGTLVATYLAGGFSWRNRTRCFEEWRRIALEYSEHPARVEAAFAEMRQDMQREELPHLTGPRLLARIGRTPGATRELKRRVRRRLGRLNRLWGRARRARSLTIPFTDPSPQGLLGTKGLSTPERFGRWTEGKRALILLEPGLGTARALSLEIHDVFGPNVGKSLRIHVGGRDYSRKLRRGKQRVRVKLVGADATQPDRIEVEIPEPASPKELGYNDDRRLLGVALTALQIRLARGPR